MVAGTSPFGHALDTKIAGYNNPNYNWNIMILSWDISNYIILPKKKNYLVLFQY
jgi:hypothetical protein